MPVLSKEDFLRRISERIGEDTSDEALQFVEDMTDTYDDFAGKANSSTDEWEKKYNDNDKMWRERYKSRFFSGHETTADEAKEDQEDNVDDDGKKRSYEELFEEREG